MWFVWYRELVACGACWELPVTANQVPSRAMRISIGVSRVQYMQGEIIREWFRRLDWDELQNRSRLVARESGWQRLF